MKRALVSTLAIAGMFVAGTAFAQPGSLAGAKLAIHLQPHAAKAQCTTNAPTALGCDASSTTQATSLLLTDGATFVSYDAYFVALDIDPNVGLAGVSFGIAYDGAGASGLDVYQSYLCADLEFPGNGWPGAGGGNVITYDANTNCQTTVDPSDPQGQAYAVLSALYCYAYSPDVLAITKRTYIPQPDIKVADCTAAETDVSYPIHAGQAGFGAQGYDPCISDEVPVSNTTWGNIKKLD